MKWFRKLFVGLLMAASLLVSAPVAAGMCSGRVINPITDICWKCIFPITVGGVPVASFSQEDFTEASVNAPVCTCPAPPPLFVRVGVTISFWEPIRLIEVVRDPFCFVSLGGVKLAPGVVAPEGEKTHQHSPQQGKSTSTAFYHAHYYIFPIGRMLEMITNFVCMESSGFDVAYMTELDPLWADDEMAFVLNPEAVIFANPVAQLACAGDCIASSAGFPLTPLFWCAGCQGGVYPLTGHISSNSVTAGGVEASSLIVHRMLYKLHRQGMLWGSAGQSGLCAQYPMPIMVKGQYKTQLVYPIPQTMGNPGHPYCCQPLGRTTMLWGLGKQFPVKGEDFTYLIWRRRDCCAL